MRLLDFLILSYFNMLSTQKSTQTLVFIAFFPFITIPNAKSGLKKIHLKEQTYEVDFLKY